MFTFLLTIISILALLLVLIILLQSGKGGGLAAAFGGAGSSTDSLIGGRQAATLLTKLTWIGGGVFLFLSLVLSVLSSRQPGRAESILRNEFGGAAQPAAAPASVLDAEGAENPLGVPTEEAAPAAGDDAETPASSGSEDGGGS
ncbi:MAG: preprotein translocase subunit SecG [Gemmatimonadota bacterium]